MTDIIHLLKTQSLKLAPFVNSLVLYFAFVRNPQGELWTTILKCLPIFCLMFFVIMKGFGFSKEYKTSQRILLGLLFSSAGDTLLNIDLFPHGMGAFAVAQIFYISAFGWKPLKPIIGIAFYVVEAIMLVVVWSGLEDVLVFGVPLYATLLLTMCWRSVARAIGTKTALNIFCAVGSVLFVISDGLIAIDMFFAKVPNARLWIMITYYAAQFAIALSTATECSSPKATPKRSKQSVQSRIQSSDSVRRRH